MNALMTTLTNLAVALAITRRGLGSVLHTTHNTDNTSTGHLTYYSGPDLARATQAPSESLSAKLTRAFTLELPRGHEGD